MERNTSQLTKKQQEMAEDNIGLAHKYAKEFANSFNLYHELDDIISICLLALCKAARTYLAADGAFSTYAYKAMKHDLYDEYSSKDGFREYTSFEYFLHDSATNLPYGAKWTLQEMVQHALNMNIINERERHMLVLRFMDRATYKEIGASFDMSASNANRIICKALLRMGSNDMFISDVT